MPSGYYASNVNSSFGAKKKSFYKNPLNLPTIHDMLITCLWMGLLLLLPVFTYPNIPRGPPFPTLSLVQRQFRIGASGR